MMGIAKKVDSTPNISVLVAGDNSRIVSFAGNLLDDLRIANEKVVGASKAVERAKEKEFDIIIVERKMRDMTGLEFLKIAKAFHPDTEVVLLDGNATARLAVRAMSLGAFDYIPDPLDAGALSSSIRRAVRKRALKDQMDYLEERVEKDYSFDGIVGGCQQMEEIFRLVRKVAPRNVPVIIQGESGTGKELIAQAIHLNSPRRSHSFLAINSASLPENLLESELFGYRRGAFTGAQRDKVGLLESANQGTLLLDEIGSMSRQLQGKLLRAMQEGEIVPVGGSEKVRIDVRFLAASNRNLWEMVEAGEFRKDLYYRLNVIEITIPPLRERKEDIPLLAQHFLDKYPGELGVARKALGRGAMRKLTNYTWPGNVRELENVIRRAMIVSPGRMIRANEIHLKKPISLSNPNAADLLSLPYGEAKKFVQSEFQKAYLKGLLSSCGGSVSKAASRSGLSRQAIHKIAKRHGLK